MSRSWSKRKIGVKSCIGFQATRMFHGRQETTYKHGNSELCPLQPRDIIASEQTFCPVLVPISSNSPFCKIPWRFGRGLLFLKISRYNSRCPTMVPLSPSSSLTTMNPLPIYIVSSGFSRHVRGQRRGRRLNLPPPWQQTFAKMALVPPNIRPRLMRGYCSRST